jgi:ABC-type nickel/cobalt efflux system permease component RcnA
MWAVLVSLWWLCYKTSKSRLPDFAHADAQAHAQAQAQARGDHASYMPHYASGRESQSHYHTNAHAHTAHTNSHARAPETRTPPSPLPLGLVFVCQLPCGLCLVPCVVICYMHGKMKVTVTVHITSEVAFCNFAFHISSATST